MLTDSPAKFLLVDDHESNLVALSAVLSRDDVEMLRARSGREALELLLQHDIALAVIDVQMPIMDGFELAELMRGSRRTQHVPIIFLTAGPQDNLRRFRGYQAGAVDFLYKPIEPDVLRSKTGIFLDLYRQREELARQRDTFITLAEEKARLLRERDEADRRLRESEMRFRTLADSAPVIIWMNGPAGCEFVNQTCLDFLGIDHLGQIDIFDWARHVHPDDRDQAAAVYRQAVEGRTRFEASLRCRRRDGTYRWIRSVGMPNLSADGGVLGYIGASFDVTESKEAEERLQRWSVDLERAVSQKTSELLQSQEQLRALATELNLTEQRERKRLATELHDYLAQLLVVVRMKLRQTIPLVTGERIPELLKDADHALTQSLDYTRSLVAELTPPTLKEFGLLQALTWLATQMHRHGLTVTVRQDAAPLPLPEDQAVLLFQSVRELLFNVLKHAKATEATIVLTVRADGQLEVVVADDGCGFVTAPKNRPGTTANRFGLFSIQERMAAMGGQLVIESVLGGGTRATLTTPYWNSREKPEDDDTLTPAESRAPSLRTRSTDVEHLSHSHHPTSKIGILLVDNHAMVRQGLRSVLEHYDDVAVVGEASTGREAIEFVERLRPAVIVMDINMPETNGIDATVEIKARHPDVAVIGLSVHNTAEARKAMLQAGATTLLSKESAVDELYAAIRQALADEGVPR
ncbi:MAG: response regulator [Nitrospira sp.]